MHQNQWCAMSNFFVFYFDKQKNNKERVSEWERQREREREKERERVLIMQHRIAEVNYICTNNYLLQKYLIEFPPRM